MKALIIDDELLARSIVKEYLQNHKDIEIIGECSDGFEALKLIASNQPDLIFLDIQMPKINGFELLELLDFMPTVIFTTAYDEYALKAFEVNAIDYLLKPFSQERFNSSIEKAKKNNHVNLIQNYTKDNQIQPEENKRIVLKHQNEIKIIMTEDIHHIESYDDYVKIHTGDKCYLKKKTMSYFEKTLAPHFIRIHRGYLMNMLFFEKIINENMSHFVQLKNGNKLPVSKTGFSLLKTKLNF